MILDRGAKQTAHAAERPPVAILRGQYLSKTELTYYEPLASEFEIVAFAPRKNSYFLHDVEIPVVQRFTPEMDLPFVGSIRPFRLRQAVQRAAISSLPYMVGLESELRRFRVIHSAETFSRYTEAALGAKRRWGTKLVVTCWENLPFLHENLYGVAPLNARGDLKRAVIEEADAFIAVTEDARDALLLEGADAKRITVIPAGVDCEKFSPADRDRELSRTLRIRSSDRVILFAGRIEWQKGVFDLLRALHLLVHDPDLSQGNILLVLKGGGSELETAVWFAERLGISGAVRCVSGKGWSDGDMEKYFNLADVCVFPSKATPHWEEQFGMVLIEAMACGRPIVTAGSGSIGQVVGDAGETIPPGDSKALYRTLKALLLCDQKRSELGLRARERALARYSHLEVARQIGRVYSRVLGLPTGRQVE
ncbi:MAG: glycosyltransferase family 4 protein [Candidatus Eisenbacteria bacterium]